MSLPRSVLRASASLPALRRGCASLLVVTAVAGASGCGPGGSGWQASQAPSAGSAPVANGATGGNLIKASTFDDGQSVPWTTSFTAPADGIAEVKNGAYCVTVKNIGSKRWDAQFRHREIVIQKDHTYTVQFKAWASAPTKARPKVGMSGPPYAEYWSSPIDLGTAPQTYVGRFTMMAKDDPTAELAFHIGADMALSPVPFELCIDEVHLDDPQFTPAASTVVASAPAPTVAVNQLGYLPHAVKIATVKSVSTSAQVWELVDSAGKVLQKGQTKVFGNDPASGEHVHLVDFSNLKTPGENLVLRVGGDTSYPFDIATNLYSKLKYDALAYFYHNRSGIEIAMPYAGEASLARPAGHLSDKSVKCQAGSGCDYALDVSGGWYDAGDHGKYVVNGGISLWTLLNWYERSKFLGSSSADFGDGKLHIPENKNGVPDILDEARWQLEFLIKMQVPDGKPLAGMAHHKMHDDAWTALGVAPHEDTMARSLHKPSTAATLNLSATAAQGARIWKGIDAAFSAKCLKAAERAWAAARQTPALFAAVGDDKGGGTYADDNVSDEFYWAASELFVTTGKPEYRQYLLASPLNARFPSEAGGHASSFNWGTTDAMGMISMAVVPSKLDGPSQKTLRARLVQAADRFLKIAEKEGYRTLIERTPDGKYIWGSNSFVVNNVIVLALAHDFNQQQKYLDGAVLGMDYLLGRNPLAQSYVSGYGEKALENPHHRFWAHQANAKYPKAPPGILSGGPNSTIDDPYSKGAGLRGCIPQKCYIDNIEAYSVNEITINWNAPLAWAAAWLDEKSKK